MSFKAKEMNGSFEEWKKQYKLTGKTNSLP